MRSTGATFDTEWLKSKMAQVLTASCAVGRFTGEVDNGCDSDLADAVILLSQMKF
jgi:hypothetical protein